MGVFRWLFELFFGRRTPPVPASLNGRGGLALFEVYLPVARQPVLVWADTMEPSSRVAHAGGHPVDFVDFWAHDVHGNPRLVFTVRKSRLVMAREI
jgi:hypothetical protein